MTGQFIAVDVETANSDRHSVCQIGLVAFAKGNASWEWSTLVNPECDFDGFNVQLHGITSHHVRLAPLWPSALSAISECINGQILVSHTRFDCDAICHATHRYGLALPACSWLDACAVAKVAWPNLGQHDLESLCRLFDIQLDHHNAASDARACGEILSRAMSETGLSVTEWMNRAGLVSPAPYNQRVSPARKRYSERIEATGDPNGPLTGHVWVCTGDFSIGEAALVALATSLGCDVKERITKKTTILVVGQRDAAQFGGKEKSRKQLDAEAAIAEGRKVTIMSEREFVELAKHYQGKTAQPG